MCAAYDLDRKPKVKCHLCGSDFRSSIVWVWPQADGSLPQPAWSYGLPEELDFLPDDFDFSRISLFVGTRTYKENLRFI